MSNEVKIDAIDKKIINILIEDARTSQTSIAKKCGISSVSVLNRIKRLKELGVITGATIFPGLTKVGFNITATIGVQTDSSPEKILDFLKAYTHVIEPSICIGEYDLSALIYAEDISSLNEKIETIRTRFGVKKIVLNVWSVPYMNFENISLEENKKGANYGQA
jgi:DNA-binding Lrp family transcriptional regulator